MELKSEDIGNVTTTTTKVRPKFKPRPGFYERRAADIEKNKQSRKCTIQAVCIINDFVY